MTNPTPTTKDLVSWKFTIALQGLVTRYGIAGPDFYKQYLPAGIPDPVHHPPKRISPRHYEIAFRAHQNVAPPGSL